MIVVDIDLLLVQRKLSVGAFADAIGISAANVAVLKNNRARAIRFSTLEAICQTLECQPGDILRYIPDDPEAPQSHRPNQHTT
ncbi:DNA-binding protein [Tsukamurella pulmonis]|nr:DNA-binding protein [Tsukamurella pulmonis]